ncbi:MAG: restriction endonuclease [Abditibacteriota bacterium]|nr:restriction endonuclease [Abditibacteriota bacterium]
MSNYVTEAVQSVLRGTKAFCKFLSANDTGQTGGHQAGIYISKSSVSILFDKLGIKGENKDRWVKIRWHDGTVTDSRFIYYGQGTRNEYRITNFGYGFPYLRPEYTGALFVFVQDDEEDYRAFVLNTDDEINRFLDAFGLSATETNNLINVREKDFENSEQTEIDRFINGLKVDFPTSEIMSATAREIQNTVYNHAEYVSSNPDRKLLEWIDVEYKLFRALEYARYGGIITSGFASIENFIVTANQVLNRRKSRAGKSLEHHLSALFSANGLRFEEQVVTEGNKKPDFLFPSQKAYRSAIYPTNKLISLAAKTTCKDRWRQVINEADRLRGRSKYLCTLQQGISATQMDEMESENVVLVVPKPYISSYPRERRNRIWTIGQFIEYVKEIEGL